MGPSEGTRVEEGWPARQGVPVGAHIGGIDGDQLRREFLSPVRSSIPGWDIGKFPGLGRSTR